MIRMVRRLIAFVFLLFGVAIALVSAFALCAPSPMNATVSSLPPPAVP